MGRWVVTALAPALAIAGCTTYDSPFGRAGAGASQVACVDRDRDGFGQGCAGGRDCDDHDPAVASACPRCAVPDEGCACDPGTAPVSCFLDKTIEDAGVVMCHEGTRRCRGGAWSACEDVHSYVRPEVTGATSLINPDAGPETCSDCDIKCFVIRDNLDPVDGGLEGGVAYGSSGGLTLGAVPEEFWTPPEVPDGGWGTGPTDNPDEEAACVIGTAPDWDCDSVIDKFDPYPHDPPFDTTADSIFLDIAPGETGTGVIDVRFFVDTLDIYLMTDATSSMQSVHQALRTALINGSFLDEAVECADTDFDGMPNQELKSQGLVGSIRCLIRDARIGVGFLREIPFDPYGDNDEVTYQNLLDVTDDTAKIVAAVDSLQNNRDKDWPDAHPLAFYSMATGNGLYMGVTKPGVPPRVGCPAGTWGYPCFREEAIPVAILMTDSPLHHGPVVTEQSYEYPIDYDPANLAITVGTTPGYFSVAPTNDTFATAFEVGNAGTKYVTYASDTRDLNANYDRNLMSCLLEGADGAKDATYTLSLSTTKAVTVAAAGVGFSPAVGVFSHAADSPTLLAAGSSNEDWLDTYDLKDMYTRWKQVSGSTAGMRADYVGDYVGCGAADASPDAVFQMSLLRDTRVSIDTEGSAFDTVVSLHSSSPVLVVETPATNTNDVGDTAQGLGDAYVRDVAVTGASTALPTIAADYTDAQIGCGADTASPDAVYSFSLSHSTRVRLSTDGSSYDTVLALAAGDLGSPGTSASVAGNDTQGEAYDAGDLVGGWKRFTGTTAGMTANYRDAFVGCGAGTASPDAVYEFSLSTSTRVRIDTTASAFDTVVSLHDGVIDPVTTVANPTNTNEVAQGALSMGTVNDNWLEVGGANTTSMIADYLGETIGCGASDPAADAVYAFQTTAPTRVRVDTVGSSFDNVLSVHTAFPPYHTVVPLSPTPELYDLGAVDDTSRVLTGDTTPLISDYGGLSMGCGAYDATHDALFRFSVSTTRSVEINTAGSGYDTAIGLYPDVVKAPKEPPPIVVPNTNETLATATNANAIDAGWQVFTGSTTQMLPNAGAFGCGAHALARDAFFRFRLNAAHNVRVDTGGSAFDSVIGLFRFSDSALLACDDDSGPGETSVLSAALPAGEYYVVVKGDGASDKGPYKLSIRDLDAANVVVCDDDLGGGGASRIVSTLQPGTYHILLKGKTPPSDGPFKIRFTDRDWFAAHHRIACDNNAAAPTDAVVEQDLGVGTYYALVKGDLATEKGPYKFRVRDVSSTIATPHNIGCNDDGATPPVSRLDADLAPGTYYVVVKGKGAAAGAYTLNLRDLDASAFGETIECNDDDPAGGTHSVIERDLPEGNYFAVVKGGGATEKGPYELRLMDVTHAVESRVSCDDDGGAGSASHIEEDLAEGDYWILLKGKAGESGAYQLSVRDMNSSMRQMLACELDGKHTMTLEAGGYDVVVKGTTNTGEGPYSLTVGNGQTSGGTFTPPAWSATLDALTDNDIRVMSILNCHDNGDHGDGRECDDARSQVLDIANATDALGEDYAPIVVDIDGNGQGIAPAILAELQALSGHLEMDVSVRLVFEPDENPGFDVAITAVDNAGDGCDGLTGITHHNCRPGATPTFHISFTNPFDDPVPPNPDDPKGGYNFRAELIADGKYFVTAIPIYVVPRDVDGTVPGSEPLLQTTGSYVQDITQYLGCTTTELPEWSDLSWTAELPTGTAVEFAVCAGRAEGDLATCAPVPVATVVGSTSCTTDATCGAGFCAANGVCQTITSGTCTSGSQCSPDASCVGGTCVYPAQPVNIGAVLGASNLAPYLRMQITLIANTSANDSPTVYDWALTYFCRGNL